MIFPCLFSWMVEPREIARCRVETTDIGAFVAIAFITSETKIIGVIQAIMLEWNHMIAASDSIRSSRPLVCGQRGAADE